MDLKKIVLLLSIIVFFSSIIAVSATFTQSNVHDIQSILQNNDETDMTGCCSIVLQQDGNNSIFSFRRDAGNAADIYIEKIDWHGKEAIKQYKTSAGYFCQVIITNDGWVIGYGGIDDGEDNKKIENITAGMITNNNTIPESGLEQVQQIKAAYGLGHLLIKAPNGNYGVATANSHYTGKLSPNQYISVPNKDGFIRTGDVQPNATDKIKTMNTLEISDGFGLTRRDITTFNFHANDTNNVTDVYIANDDGSYWGMSTAGLVDTVNFTGKIIKPDEIPIAPSYKYIGNITFEGQDNADTNGGGSFDILGILVWIIIAVIVGVVAFFSYHTIKVLRYRNRYRRR